MIVVTGATGQLGQLVIEHLLKRVPASKIAAAVRNPDKAGTLAARGITVREADYDRPETLARSFAAGDKVLLISSSEIGRRLPQHQAVIDAARRANVGLLAYTSLLHADTSPLPLAAEHKATEAALRASGLPVTILRNGWYSENYLAGIDAILAHGAVLGCAGDGRIASAARNDYAEAAAVVMSGSGHVGKTYELAGDQAYTLADLAAEIAAQAGQPIAFHNLPQAEYRGILINAGLPEGLADLLAESDTGAAQGGLFDDSRQLGKLIGRPTTSLADSVRSALGKS
ncbi:SDR family oxidoreductase [Azonexus hydrophilus]|uniref:SDR family oxidoreductase n=1 Tax=Azonexus hydrophilus TaxID=418702 RepID=A0ABZ2XE30_9RHOO